LVAIAAAQRHNGWDIVPCDRQPLASAKVTTVDDSTCWTIIAAAARGDAAGREEFARHYAKPVRAYLLARWRGSVHLQQVDDAVQEVFVECFRTGGVVERVDPARAGGFRPFLYGVVRNVARQLERRWATEQARAVSQDALAEQPADDSSLAVVFDRAWARAVVRQAARRHHELAERDGAEAVRRVELLRLRFQEGKPIRDIARLWRIDADHLHHEYAKARKEFHQALMDIVAIHCPGPPDVVERECRELLSLLE
jgi:RNA polymerase sigma-70 factor (ECF subfamily)